MNYRIRSDCTASLLRRRVSAVTSLLLMLACSGCGGAKPPVETRLMVSKAEGIYCLAPIPWKAPDVWIGEPTEEGAPTYRVNRCGKQYVVICESPNGPCAEASVVAERRAQREREEKWARWKEDALVVQSLPDGEREQAFRELVERAAPACKEIPKLGIHKLKALMACEELAFDGCLPYHKWREGSGIINYPDVTLRYYSDARVAAVSSAGDYGSYRHEDWACPKFNDDAEARAIRAEKRLEQEKRAKAEAARERQRARWDSIKQPPKHRSLTGNAARDDARCRAGDDDACWEMGCRFANGIDVPQNKLAAMRYMYLMCERGPGRGCYYMNQMEQSSGTLLPLPSDARKEARQKAWERGDYDLYQDGGVCRYERGSRQGGIYGVLTSDAERYVDPSGQAVWCGGTCLAQYGSNVRGMHFCCTVERERPVAACPKRAPLP